MSKIEYKNPIFVNMTCACCNQNYNIIIDKTAFCGPFDNASGDGRRVQYVEMTCAKCGKLLTLETDYIADDDSAPVKATINSDVYDFSNIPAIEGRSVESGKIDYTNGKGCGFEDGKRLPE